MLGPVAAPTPDDKISPRFDLSAVRLAHRLENLCPRRSPLIAAMREAAFRDGSRNLEIDSMATAGVNRPSADLHRSRGRKHLSAHPPTPLMPTRPCEAPSNGQRTHGHSEPSRPSRNLQRRGSQPTPRLATGRARRSRCTPADHRLVPTLHLTGFDCGHRIRKINQWTSTYRSSTPDGKPPWRNLHRRQRPASGISQATVPALEITQPARATYASRTTTTLAPAPRHRQGARIRPRHRGGAGDDPAPRSPRSSGSLTTPGANPEAGTPLLSRSAGSSTAARSGAPKHKSISHKHMQRRAKARGAGPQRGLSYPERPRPGS